MTYRPGREFLNIPGPTNIPDRVLGAMHRPALDFLSPEFIAINPPERSDSVTAVLMPERIDAEAFRARVLAESKVALGVGLGKLNGRVLRIGHLGDLNEPMLLGALATIELHLQRQGIPHGKGGVAAAISYLAGN